MFDQNLFKIDLNKLKEGLTTITLQLDDDFFKALETTDVQRGDVKVDLTISRIEDVFELAFHIEGTIYIPCDLCLEDMDQFILTDNKLVAKFGAEDSEDDDMVTVAENEGILDVSWYIYEFIVLAIPIKHVHAPGKCNPAMIRMLEEHSVARSDKEEGEQTIDSRWDALRKLKE
nr:DUF177 domain-containing protein [Prevotella sp.]